MCDDTPRAGLQRWQYVATRSFRSDGLRRSPRIDARDRHLRRLQPGLGRRTGPLFQSARPWLGRYGCRQPQVSNGRAPEWPVSIGHCGCRPRRAAHLLRPSPYSGTAPLGPFGRHCCRSHKGHGQRNCHQQNSHHEPLPVSPLQTPQNIIHLGQKMRPARPDGDISGLDLNQNRANTT